MTDEPTRAPEPGLRPDLKWLILLSRPGDGQRYMDEAMTKRWIVLLTFVVSLIGCTTQGIRSGRQISEAFDSIDSIEVDEVILSDPQLIAELKAIHSRSKWATPITMPSDLVAIYGVDDGVRRFKLVYGAGWLWETDEGGQNARRKTLNENDRKWMEENIRLKVPPKPNSF